MRSVGELARERYIDFDFDFNFDFENFEKNPKKNNFNFKTLSLEQMQSTLQKHSNLQMEQMQHNVKVGKTGSDFENKAREAKVEEVENLAKELTRCFNAPQNYQFFLKCAWHLPPSLIEEVVVTTSKKPWLKDPLCYATAALRNQLRARGF